MSVIILSLLGSVICFLFTYNFIHASIHDILGKESELWDFWDDLMANTEGFPIVVAFFAIIFGFMLSGFYTTSLFLGPICAGIIYLSGWQILRFADGIKNKFKGFFPSWLVKGWNIITEWNKNRVPDEVEKAKQIKKKYQKILKSKKDNPAMVSIIKNALTILEDKIPELLLLTHNMELDIKRNQQILDAEVEDGIDEYEQRLRSKAEEKINSMQKNLDSLKEVIKQRLEDMHYMIIDLSSDTYIQYDQAASSVNDIMSEVNQLLGRQQELIDENKVNLEKETRIRQQAVEEVRKVEQKALKI